MRWFRKRDDVDTETEAAAEPSTPGRVTGTTGKDGKVLREPSEAVVEGVMQVRDFVIEWGPLEVNDPRLAGRATVVLNADVHKESESVEVVPQAIALRIEDETGSWSGQGTSISRGRGAVPPAETLNLDTIVLRGAGAYEGLAAYLIVDGTHDPATVDGAIFAGSVPPIPRLPDQRIEPIG